MSKIKYSNKHIDALVKRLRAYEEYLNNEPITDVECHVCDDVGTNCTKCVLGECFSETAIRARVNIRAAWRYRNTLSRSQFCFSPPHTRTSDNKRIVRNWYNTMIRRANKNLEKANSCYRLEMI